MSVDNSLQTKTPFGLKDGRMHLPTEVESGLACGCSCPECGARLVAKQGQGSGIIWHFAHHNAVPKKSCYETSIHAAAKQVLLDANWLDVPEKHITVSGLTKYGALHTKSEVLIHARTVHFDYSQAEVWETNLRPDVVGYRGKHRLLVEMFFTHQVDEVKRRKLEAMNLSTIEIDLSELALDAGFEAVRQRVLHDTAKKTWLVYPGKKEAIDALNLMLDEEIAQMNLAYDEQLAARQRKEERELTERERKKAQELAEQLRRKEYQRKKELAAERAQQEIEDENARYRALPRIEKERLLRKSLGMVGDWPYYLNKGSPEASAINEEVRIWQAALFLQFVFEKRTANPMFLIGAASQWVVDLFGTVDNRTTEAFTAVKKFLAYLRACGFLVKSRYNPYEPDYYTVVHDELKPLTPPTKKTVKVEALAPPAIVKPHWLWRASWPTKMEMLERATSLLESSPHKETLLQAIENLSPQSRPNEPHISALLLQREGVPMEATLDFLVALGLALKTTRTI